MFTGLIEATGRIERVAPGSGGVTIRIATSLGAEVRDGDSIAVNGVCLTVARRDDAGFEAAVSPETARVTTLGATTAGRPVNLERPLRADARLGGHFVLGHVDAVGTLISDRADGEHRWIEVSYPPALAPFLISKGSIAIDGISLTVAALLPDRVGVQIVPFTRLHTTLEAARPGDLVNLEADVLGKYVARLHELRPETTAPAATREDSESSNAGARASGGGAPRAVKMMTRTEPK
jgi:riboflavin synthase